MDNVPLQEDSLPTKFNFKSRRFIGLTLSLAILLSAGGFAVYRNRSGAAEVVTAPLFTPIKRPTLICADPSVLLVTGKNAASIRDIISDDYNLPGSKGTVLISGRADIYQYIAPSFKDRPNWHDQFALNTVTEKRYIVWSDGSIDNRTDIQYYQNIFTAWSNGFDESDGFHYGIITTNHNSPFPPSGVAPLCKIALKSFRYSWDNITKPSTSPSPSSLPSPTISPATYSPTPQYSPSPSPSPVYSPTPFYTESPTPSPSPSQTI
jgi:hypothetical protein